MKYKCEIYWDGEILLDVAYGDTEEEARSNAENLIFEKLYYEPEEDEK